MRFGITFHGQQYKTIKFSQKYAFLANTGHRKLIRAAGGFAAGA